MTSTNDSGPGSLRQGILDANAGFVNAINFNLGAGVQTISLSSAALDITAKNLSINGPGDNVLTVTSNYNWQDFIIEAGATVTISGLTIANGLNNNYGGNIYSDGTLTLSGDIVSGGVAGLGGGGIFNDGRLTINSTLVTGNTGGNGAGIENVGGTVGITNSTFTYNTSPNGYGGAISNSGTLVLTSNHFTSNSAAWGGGGLFNNGTATVVAVTFTSNTTGGKGGGIFSSPVHGNVYTYNVTFSGNQADQATGGTNDNADVFGTITSIY